MEFKVGDRVKHVTTGEPGRIIHVLSEPELADCVVVEFKHQRRAYRRRDGICIPKSLIVKEP